MAWTAWRTWVAGETVTAALMNAQIRDNGKAISDPWGSYTPTWTGSAATPVLGNGTLTGNFLQVGKWVRFRIDLTYGSTTTSGAAGNLWQWTLPVTAAVALSPIGVGSCFGGGVLYPRVAICNSSTSVVLADMAAARVGFGVPFTWASANELHIIGQYESV